MKKIIPVLVAIVLILIIAAVGFGTVLIDKYSFVSGDHVTGIL